MCGSPLMSKIREMSRMEAELRPPVHTTQSPIISTKNYNMLFISSLMPIFRRVKGFLYNLLFAYYNNNRDALSSTAIESPQPDKQNNNTLDIMAAFAAHCSAQQQKDEEEKGMKTIKSTTTTTKTTIRNNSKILEGILSGLPQYYFAECDGTKATTTKVVKEESVKHPRKQVDNNGWIIADKHRNKRTNAKPSRHNTNSFALTSRSSPPEVDFLHFVPTVPSNEHHHHHQSLHQRKSTMATSPPKKLFIKNNREKKRHDLTRDIHDDTMWDAVSDDDHDTVDHCCIILEATAAIVEPVPVVTKEPAAPVPSGSGNAGILIVEQFCHFTLADFPSMSKSPTSSSSESTPRRAAISWEVPLDRVPAERPARLQRLARPLPASTRRSSRRRLYSEDSNASLPSANTTQTPGPARLSIENIQQHRAQFGANRMPRERQISEASDDFICFEESPDCDGFTMVDDEMDGEMFSDSDTEEEEEEDDDDEEADEDTSECETESEEDEESDEEEVVMAGEENNNKKENLGESTSVKSGAHKKVVSIANPADSGYEDKKKLRFSQHIEVHVLRTWRFAYQEARKSKWEQIGRDHARFQDRIGRLADILNPILAHDHRENVFKRMLTATSNQV